MNEWIQNINNKNNININNYNHINNKNILKNNLNGKYISIQYKYDYNIILKENIIPEDIQYKFKEYNKSYENETFYKYKNNESIFNDQLLIDNNSFNKYLTLCNAIKEL